MSAPQHAEQGLPPEQVDLSILIPVYNEVDNLLPLWTEIEAVLDELNGLRSEVVFVDDGSSDGSQDVLRTLAEKAPDRVRVVYLRRNYGQTAALDAALTHAQGRVLVPMDADQQNDPADIPRLLREIAQGADVVSGWRQRRKDTFLTRRLPSLIANAIIARMTGVRIHDFGCTLKAYRREILEGVRLYGEMHRFIPAYAAWNGATITELVVNHRPRTLGQSKYGIWRTFKVVLDLLTVLFIQRGYAARPLHLFGAGGMALVSGALSLAVYTLYQKSLFPLDDPRHIFVHRNPLSSLAAMFGVLGAGAVGLGLVAELLSRIYHLSAGSSYTLAGGYNVPGVQTVAEARDLGPAFQQFASEPPTPEGTP
tara:strand:- start:1239 stop:2339 length:1101 start_codon:yes stop_codon:yes gene_type:complete